MTAKADTILTAVAAQLATIRTANGYHTNAGLYVHRTLLGMALPENLSYPALFLRLDGLDISNLEYRDTRCSLSVTVEGAVSISGQSAPDSALLLLLWDIRAALLVETAFKGLLHGSKRIAPASASFRLPEGGQSIAMVIQPFTLNFAERYQV